MKKNVMTIRLKRMSMSKIRGDVTAWHLKIEDVTIGDAAFGTHEEGFIKKRSLVMCDRPLQGKPRLRNKKQRKNAEKYVWEAAHYL